MSGETTWCTFRLGGRLFGIEVERVQEVLRSATVTRVPLAPSGVRGLVNLRGTIVAAFDLRPCLGLEVRDDPAPPQVVVRTDAGVATVVVDAIEDVSRTLPDQFEPCPETVTSPARTMMRGCCKLERELLLALDLDRALEVAAGPDGREGGAYAA